MLKYIIERNMQGVGKSTQEQIKNACQKSNDTLRDMSNRVQWQQSFVTDDKLYCVYLAQNKDEVREHASKSGFPADRIEEVHSVIDPVTA